MNSKRSAKRLPASRASQKAEKRPSPKDLIKLVRELPERMIEAEAYIKDTLGPDGMRKVLGIANDLDPVVLATIAASLVPERDSQQEDRRALVRAAMLLTEAQKIVKDGPTIFDIPVGALAPVMKFWNHPAKQELDAINQIAEPKKRLAARVKFITGQDKLGRAETDLSEMLGQWAKELDKPDISAYKKVYRDLFASQDLEFWKVILWKDVFTEWKTASKSQKAAGAAKARALKVSV